MTERHVMPHGQEIEDAIVARMRRDLHPRPVTRARRLTAPVWSAIATATAVAVVVAAVVLTNVLAPGPSYAATPPLLEVTPTSADAEQLLTELSATAAAQPHAAEPGVIRYQSWVLGVDVDAEGNSISQYIQPQDVTVTAVDDAAEAQVTIRAGEPFDIHGEALPGTDAATAPGTVLSEYAVPPPASTPPENAAEWPMYLESGFGVATDAPAGQVLLQVSGILNYWTLTPQQNAAFLAFLAGLPDLHAAGDTIDRLGRPGIVFTARKLDEQWQLSLVVSPDTGRILAVENVYVGDARTDIPSPAVVDYTTWK